MKIGDKFKVGDKVTASAEGDDWDYQTMFVTARDSDLMIDKGCIRVRTALTTNGGRPIWSNTTAP